jgi:hypothetical protein
MTIDEGCMLSDNDRQNIERIKDKLEREIDQLDKAGRYGLDTQATLDDIGLLLEIIKKLDDLNEDQG